MANSSSVSRRIRFQSTRNPACHQIVAYNAAMKASAKPTIYLAPMEGVVNARMRALLSRGGGIDRCVTEFVRVTDTLLPPRVFLRLCPELESGGTTPSGVPVYVQLLGSNPQALAENAKRAAEMGAPGVDLNFGCPAKTVNRHRGGAILLREPELIGNIVSRVREAMPASVPLTVKMRLGVDNHNALQPVAGAIAAAGASELIVHARSKQDGYKPPAHWHKLNGLNTHIGIPVIANGEIWTPADAEQCSDDSGCHRLMLGRGLLARPDLARRLRFGEQAQLSWPEIIALLLEMLDDCRIHCQPRHVGGPVKQWLAYLRLGYDEAGPMFERCKRLRAADDLAAALSMPIQQAA